LQEHIEPFLGNHSSSRQDPVHIRRAAQSLGGG
jgi:hypothetical protein